jgi:hypothetical protein
MTEITPTQYAQSINLLIIERDHYEVLSNLIKFFSFNNNRITCIVSKPVHEKLIEIFGTEQTVFTPFIIPEHMNRFKMFLFFQKIITITKPHLLFLCSVSSNHLLYALLLKKNKAISNVLSVHDINCLFTSVPSKGIKNRIIFIGKKRLLKAVTAFNVITDTMVKTLNEKLHHAKNVYSIPGAVYSGQNKFEPLTKCIKIAVPGSIEAKRRNYTEVAELVLAAEKNNIPIEVHLAGGYDSDEGHEIVKNMNDLDIKICKVINYQKQGLSQNEFERCIKNAHFIYMPLVLNISICPGIEEVYGTTKSSGNVSDAIQFAKPFIAPDALAIPDNLKSSCFKYQNINDTLLFFSSLLQNPAQYTQLCNTALTNAIHYTVDNARMRNQSIFNKNKS